ncbi:MAG: hypothetical protein HOI45_11665 [Rhodospirillaceae bacterium]|jgi:hypothetical protein|nr:hypothetical protein [Rhodospirillaceae bacterium]
MGHTITFAAAAEDHGLIEAEQQRMRKLNPGMKVSKSAAIRSMIHRASTITDQPAPGGYVAPERKAAK